MKDNDHKEKLSLIRKRRKQNNIWIDQANNNVHLISEHIENGEIKEDLPKQLIQESDKRIPVLKNIIFNCGKIFWKIFLSFYSVVTKVCARKYAPRKTMKFNLSKNFIKAYKQKIILDAKKYRNKKES